MLRIIFVVTALLLAIPARAQDACLRDGKWEQDFAKLWAQEAERSRNQAPDVSRQGERLSLKLDGGKSVELIDCPYGTSGHAYLFDRFDEAGPFYVVSKTGYEDFLYTLVMRRDGRLYDVEGLPIWSADRSRFVTVGCAIARDQKTLRIHSPSADGITTEAEFPLPCAEQSCSARWDSQSWISVSCTPHDGSGKKGAEFVLMRGNDKTWRRFGR
jgi:hypothetical protein